MFEENITIDLDLSIGNNVYNIPGANIKNVCLDLFSYGFSGNIGFWVILDTVTDDLYKEFVKQDIIEVRISVSGVFNLPSPPPSPLIVTGIVTEKSLLEERYKDVSGIPVLQRYYELTFVDAPAALWTQHYPAELYVGKNMKDIIKVNTVEGITVDIDFDVLGKELPMLCLGPGDNNEASFYDFLIWYIKSKNGVCLYDYENQKFCLSGKKPADKKPVLLRARDIKDISICMPETIRQNIRMLNASADLAKSVEVDQKQAVKGISYDLIVCEDIAMDFESRTNLEKSKLKHREHELLLTFNQFPTVTFRPGSLLSFNHPEWSGRDFIKKKKYRVYELHFNATAKEEDAGKVYNDSHAVYKIEMEAKLEHIDNPVAFFPEFKKPSYPVSVEGKIVSLAGKPTDKTYQIFSNQKTSQDFYSVLIPLWNSPIMVPFVPDVTTGHFFFPAFTNTRVLLDIFCDRAEISDHLDWGDSTRLSADSQGNHILFGKNNESKTSLKYMYKDNKPLFSIERISGVDTESIRLEEGGIVLQTKEDDSLKKVDETFDLTPKVAAANAELAMEKSAAVNGVTGSFESTKSEVNEKLDAAVAETKAKLEEMDSAISGKVDEVDQDIKSAMQKLEQNEGRLKSASASMKDELMENISL